MVWKISADTDGRYTPGVRAPNERHEGNAERGGTFFDVVVRPFQSGRKLEHPERVPKIGLIPKPRKRFYTIMSIFDQIAGTQELVDLVEKFEPNTHQFYPLDLVASNTGETMPVRYYLMNVCNRLDSVVLDHPAVRYEVIHLRGKDHLYWTRTRGDIPLDFHRDRIAGHHLWRDSGDTVGIYASDEFVEAMETSNFKGWRKSEHYEAV